MFERRPSDSRIDLSGLRIRSGFSSAAVPTYAAVLRDTYLASEVWPLVNISAGTTISAFITSARNGTQTGWTLQNVAGPVTGTLAPLSAAGDFGGIHTVNLAGIFDPLEGGLFAWGSVTSWTDGVLGYLASMGVNNNNVVQIFKRASNNELRVLYAAGGTSKLVTIATSVSGFFSVGITWSKSSDEVKAYYQGAQSGTTQTGLGTWVGALATTRTAIGSFDGTTSTTPWLGHMAYVACKFGSVWTLAQIAAMHTAAATAGPDV